VTSADLIHEILKVNPDGISGERIAETLGISRNAVWKAIEELRRRGAIIDGASGRGYRLTGERFISEPLMRKYLGASVPLHVYESITSTNDIAKSEAENGAVEGSLYIAESQSAGKGRTGKSFWSPSGTGIYMSIVLRPSIPASEALMITTCAAVAVSEALEELTGKGMSIKWVNDIFYEKKKICGILTEASFNMETGGLNYAVLGIGVDLFAPKDGFGELSSVAGSLYPYRENTGDIRSQTAAAIYEKFFMHYRSNDADYLFANYRQRLFILGRQIGVLRQGKVRSAVVLGIEKNYNLIVRYENGDVESLSSGEISIIPE
jgi:BirA family biotin operon repressor/biotin-[acetyl-CoA-carboxylase] ligase